jgi:hypothetical protein
MCGKWTNQQFKEAIDIYVKSEKTFLRKVNTFWNVPFTSLFNHLNGKTRSKKMEPPSVLIERDDGTIIA